MTTYGVTDQGFVLKPTDAIKADLEQGFAAQFGAGINLSPQSVFGQIIGITTDRIADVWLLGEAVYNAHDPDGASGASLDQVCGLTGTQRAPQKFSTVYVTLTGTPGAVIPSGRVFSVTNSGAKFATTADATIGADGTVANVLCAAQNAGPVAAPAGTLTVIETPYTGLASVTNPADATLGAYVESDPNLRADREANLRAQGNAALEAIREKVAKVAGVTTALGYENDTDSADANGRRPHSVEIVVQGGADADIAAAIFASKAGGMQTTGSTSVNVTDSMGVVHAIKFSRPTVKLAYVAIHVTTDPGTFPADGVSQIQQAVATYGDSNLKVASSLITSQLNKPAFGVSGVVDVTAIYVGFAANPTTSANLPAGSTELIDLDTSRITVTVS